MIVRPVTVTYSEPMPGNPFNSPDVTRVSDGEFVVIFLGDLREVPAELLAQALAQKRASLEEAEQNTS